MAAAAARKRIVLHFDLNRTCLISDAAGGRTMDMTVNYLLSEVTWGAAQGATWTCAAPEPSVAAPSAEAVTYKAFVDAQLPYLNQAVDAAPEGFDSVKAFNKAQKKQRTALQSAFTSEGSPGAALAGFCESTVQALHFDAEAAARAREVAGTLEDGLLKEFWLAGKHFLLPSFLRLLLHVQDPAACAFDVSFVFRTFGLDLLEVAKEINVLCEGRHPLLPGVTLDAAFRLDAPFGVFFRDGYGSDGLTLAMGTIDKVPAGQTADEFYAGQEGVVLHRGFAAAAAAIEAELAQRRCVGLRDYWEWWSAHGEDAAYAKVLLVDANSEAHACFIDDHVEAHHAHIVDARDLATGEPIPFDQAIGKYMMRAEPYEAIVREDYFVELFGAVAGAASA